MAIPLPSPPLLPARWCQQVHWLSAIDIDASPFDAGLVIGDEVIDQT